MSGIEGSEAIRKLQLAERALGMPGNVRAGKDTPLSQLPA